MTDTQFVTPKDSAPHSPRSAGALPLPDKKPGIANPYLAAPVAATPHLPLSVRSHFHV